MHRMAPRNEIPDHEVEIFFLNGLLADIKLWLHDIEPRKDILKRIHEWQFVHAPNLIKCHSYNFKPLDNLGRPKKLGVQRGHESAVTFLSALFADAEKKLDDQEHDGALTDERFEEAREHVDSLESCKHQRIWY